MHLAGQGLSKKLKKFESRVSISYQKNSYYNTILYEFENAAASFGCVVFPGYHDFPQFLETPESLWMCRHQVEQVRPLASHHLGCCKIFTVFLHDVGSF